MRKSCCYMLVMLTLTFANNASYSPHLTTGLSVIMLLFCKRSCQYLSAYENPILGFKIMHFTHHTLNTRKPVKEIA